LPTVRAERRLRLVDWFNRVDATYRTEPRELNELNFGRFGAKLEALEVGLVFGVVRLTGR